MSTVRIGVLGGSVLTEAFHYRYHRMMRRAVEVAQSGDLGVDRWMRADRQFPGGATGKFSLSLYGARLLRIGFRVIGSKGELRVFNPAGPHLAHRFTVRLAGGTERRETFPKIPTYTAAGLPLRP